MSGVDESSPDTSPTLFNMETYEQSEASMWPTPQARGDSRGEGGAASRDTHQSMLHHAVRSRPSISSAAASPASPSATPDSARAMQTSAGSGLSLGALFAKLDPATSLWKTSQACFQSIMGDSLEVFSQTWPRSGSMRNGTVSEHRTSVPRTYESGFSSWHIPTPTPTDAIMGDVPQRAVASKPNEGMHGVSLKDWIRWPSLQAHDAGKGDPARVGRYGTKHSGRNLNDEVLLPTPKGSPEHYGRPRPNDRGDLQAAVMLPTPIARDSRSFKGAQRAPNAQGSEPLVIQIGGQLNPTFVEWLMGFPKDWSVI